LIVTSFFCNTFVFDNTFSWARGKNIHYTVEVILPVDTGMASEINLMLENGLTWSDIANSSSDNIMTTKL